MKSNSESEGLDIQESSAKRLRDFDIDDPTDPDSSSSFESGDVETWKTVIQEMEEMQRKLTPLITELFSLLLLEGFSSGS